MNATLILDLDHTLVHSVPDTDKGKYGIDKEIDPDFRVTGYEVYTRPGLKDFLEFSFYNFPRVIIWTAGDHMYAHSIISQLPIPDGMEFYRIITRDTYGTCKKNMELLMTDPSISSTAYFFVDDIPDRISNANKESLIVADRFEFHHTTDMFLYILQGIFLSLTS